MCFQVVSFKFDIQQSYGDQLPAGGYGGRTE